MPHRPLRAVVVVGCAALLSAVGLGSAGVAAAAPVVPAAFPTSGAVTGDVTGDGWPDRVAIGSGTSAAGVVTCTASVRAGLPGGGTAPVTRIRLPVHGLQYPDSFPSCPDLLVVLPGPTPQQNRLATNWRGFPPAGGASIQVFDLTGSSTIARYDSGFSGQSNPSGGIATADFDGDGWGDIYQPGTDQGEGLDSWVRRGSSWVPFYSTGGTPGAGSIVIDLDRGPGVDLLVTTTSYTDTAFVDVVDGLTGRVQRLATGADDPAQDVYGFTADLVDLDHNAYLDVVVTPLLRDGDGGGGGVPRYFRNRSQGGRWSFVPTTAPDVTPPG